MTKIRYGMVGGGEGAFIGAIHRHATQLDGQYQLVCGSFSSNPERSRESGTALGLVEERCYADFSTMMAAESTLPEDQRMQCVIIVTPNHLHFPVAKAALAYGFHVMSDKPATFTLEESQQLATLLEETGLLYGLTHPYTAYPMIREARQRIAAGELGQVRKIIVEYTQGWLSQAIETEGNAQAAWRLNPEKAGASCCMGDIGVHAFNLAEFVSGLTVTRLSAELHHVVSGRTLDDDGNVRLAFNSGARGLLLASQICTGEENNLRLRIYGDEASLDWQQMEPNSLWLKYNDRPAELIRTGMPNVGPSATANTRVPAGHPEGYIEAFANLYREFAAALRIHQQGEYAVSQVPGIEAALRGMAFIETAVASNQAESEWQYLDTGDR